MDGKVQHTSRRQESMYELAMAMYELGHYPTWGMHLLYLVHVTMP
jgi:hypothetical protein